MSLVYNERSWAIDLISELNAIVKNQNLEIVRASGEAGLKNVKGFLFPDAILYGKNANVLMGWELKMPDTAIEDLEFYENAKKKADLLGTNSFLLWNGKTAKLYGRDKDTFVELKAWNEPKLVDRKTMGAHHDYWINLLKQIVQDLEFFFASGKIPAAKMTQVLDEDFIVNIIEALYRSDAAEIKNEYQKSAKFRAELDAWSHENGLPKSDARFDELAKLNILSWINRFIFSHYLATKSPKAQIIHNITAGSTVTDALQIFETITQELDYSQIFKPGIGNELISKDGWDGRIQLNIFLTSAHLTDLPDDIFKSVLDNFAESSRRKALGQFATPQLLARLLVKLTIDDATAPFLDTCVGSGTFVKEAYEHKKELGIAAPDAFQTLWASDKYQLPLQVTTLNLVDDGAKNFPLQVFKSDVFDLFAGKKIELVDPKNFKETIEKPLPLVNAIASNLPFIRFESTSGRGPADVANDLFTATNLDAAKKLGKADIYATIIFQLWQLIEDGGNLGVIVSNSWMGTDWGKSFQELLSRYFTIEAVIRSGNKRWFNNADVITNLLILKKKSDINKTASSPINFVSTLVPIDEWNDEIVNGFISSIHTATSISTIRTKSVSKQDQSEIEKAGYSIRANFYECPWVNDFTAKSIPISDLFEVARGARRGWNPLFYPDSTSTIEKEFLIPALKTTSKQTYLIAQPDSLAFCCEESLDDLKKDGKTGALNWVKQFEGQVNGNGIPLPEVLAGADFFWYQMKSNEKANFVISMNPYENLSFLQIEPPAFVDQRLIRINPKLGVKVDLELIHALMNTSLSLLGIELLGFERGLGVLDISATALKKQFRILDPALLTEAPAKAIKDKFQVLKKRKMLATLDEIERDDRKEFDREVLKAFGLGDHQDVVYEILKLTIKERTNH